MGEIPAFLVDLLVQRAVGDDLDDPEAGVALSSPFFNKLFCIAVHE